MKHTHFYFSCWLGSQECITFSTSPYFFKKTWSSFYSTLLKWSLSTAFKNISTKGTRTPSYSKESWKVDPTYSVQLLWSWEVSLNVTWLIHWPWVKSLSIDRCLGRQSWVKCPAQLLSSVVLRQTEFKLDPTKS